MKRGNKTKPKPKTAVFANGIPSPPDFLDNVGVQEFNRVARELDQAGMLRQVDWAVVVAYAHAWSDFDRLSRKIVDEGEVIETPRGGLQQNPLCLIQERAHSRMILAARELGFSPVSSRKLPAAKKAEADPLGEMMGE